MKALLLSFTLSLMAHIAYGLVEFEVQPLSLRTTREVLGVHMGWQGQDAIVLTGHAAERVASKAGYVLNRTSEMLVVTGSEVSQLIAGSLGGAYGLGKFVLIKSTQFASSALQLAFTTFYSGVRFVFLTIGVGVSLGKNIVAGVINTLHKVGTVVYVLSNSGWQLLKIPLSLVGTTLDFVCQIPHYFGINLYSCN